MESARISRGRKPAARFWTVPARRLVPFTIASYYGTLWLAVNEGGGALLDAVAHLSPRVLSGRPVSSTARIRFTGKKARLVESYEGSGRGKNPSTPTDRFRDDLAPKCSSGRLKGHHGPGRGIDPSTAGGKTPMVGFPKLTIRGDIG